MKSWGIKDDEVPLLNLCRLAACVHYMPGELSLLHTICIRINVSEDHFFSVYCSRIIISETCANGIIGLDLRMSVNGCFYIARRFDFLDTELAHALHQSEKTLALQIHGSQPLKVHTKAFRQNYAWKLPSTTYYLRHSNAHVCFPSQPLSPYVVIP